jgi:hypothetical protein
VSSGKRGHSVRDVIKATVDEEVWSLWSSSGGDNDANANNEEECPWRKLQA